MTGPTHEGYPKAMRKPWYTFALVVSMAAFAACEDDAASPARTEEASAVAEEALEALADEAPPQEPCALLGAALVREVLSLDASVQLDGGPSAHVPQLCRYTWANPDYDPAAQMRRLMKGYRPGSDGEVDADAIAAAPAHFEASLTLTRPHPDSASAERSLEEAVQRIGEGISAMAAGRTANFQSDARPVEGVGDQAYWIERSHELLVRFGARRVTIGAHIAQDEESNVQAAQALARAIAAEF